MVHVEEKKQEIRRKLAKNIAAWIIHIYIFKYCCACITEDQPTYNGYNGKKNRNKCYVMHATIKKRILQLHNKFYFVVTSIEL